LFKFLFEGNVSQISIRMKMKNKNKEGPKQRRKSSLR